MKRRHFIKAIGLASAAVVFAKDLFARETAAHVITDKEFDCVFKAKDQRTIFKVTGLLIHIGQESAPYSVTANEDGYLTLPDLGNADQYALYAPMPGFEQSGPWYLMRVISRREARRARFTIVAPINYRTSDLVPQLCPRERLSFTLPPPAEGQTDWRIYGGDLNGPASVLIDVP